MQIEAGVQGEGNGGARWLDDCKDRAIFPKNFFVPFKMFWGELVAVAG